jgi:iron(III) transport system permease protein
LVRQTGGVAALLVSGIVVLAGLAIPIALAFQGGGHGLDLGILVPRWVALFTNTAVVGVIASTVALLGGIVVGLFAFKIHWTGRRALLAVVAVGAALPSYVTFTAALAAAGVSWAMGSAVAVGVFAGLMHIPLAAVFVGIGLMYVEPELEQAALLEWSPDVVLRRVSLRRIVRTLIAAAVVVLWFVTTDYSISDVLQVRTFAEEIFTEYGVWGLQARPLVIAAPLVVTTVALVAVLTKLSSAWRRGLLQNPARWGMQLRLGGRGELLGWIVLVICVACAGWPLYMVFSQLLDWATMMARLEAFIPEWGRTVHVASWVAVISAPTAVCLAWMGCRSNWARWPVGTALLALLSVPAPALAIAMVWILSHTPPSWLAGVIGDPAGVLLDHPVAMHVVAIVVRYIPVAVIIVWPAIQGVPQELEDTASLDGLSWWRKLRDVYWPLAGGRAALAGAVMFILSVGELDCVHMVAPPDGELLSIRLATFIHNGVDADVAAVCLAATVTTAPVALFVLWALDRGWSAIRSEGLRPDRAEKP